MRTRSLIGAAVLAAGALLLAGCGLFNTPPVASFIIVYHVDQEDPLWVTLDASASSDADGDRIVAYQWNFGDDVTIHPATYSSLVTVPVITVRYPVEGTYTVTLAVRDEHDPPNNTSLTVSQTMVLPPPQVRPVD